MTGTAGKSVQTIKQLVENAFAYFSPGAASESGNAEKKYSKEGSMSAMTMQILGYTMLGTGVAFFIITQINDF